MASAQDRGWGDPDSTNYRSRVIRTITIAGVRLAIHREVAHLFAGFIGELTRGGYRLDISQDDWGYANRCVRGTGLGTGRPCVKSNHSWGLAVDLNAIDNPMTAAHPHHGGQVGHNPAGVHTDMPPGTAELAARWGLTWGANYRGTRKDAMHFEFLGTPADVANYPKPAQLALEEIRAMAHVAFAEPAPGTSRDGGDGSEAVCILFDNGDVHFWRGDYQGGPNQLRDDVKAAGVGPYKRLIVWARDRYSIVTTAGVLLDFNPGTQEFVER